MSKAGIRRFYEAAKSSQEIRTRLGSFQSPTSAAFYARTLGFQVEASDFDEIPLEQFKSITDIEVGQAPLRCGDASGLKVLLRGQGKHAAARQHFFSGASSSVQGLLSGLAIGFIGQAAVPFLLLTIPLDHKSISKWRLLGGETKPKKRLKLCASAVFSMGVNALFSFIGISVMAPMSPMGTTARQQYFRVIATPVIARNAEVLGKQSHNLLVTPASFWLDPSQKSKLMAKLKTVESVNSVVRGDRALYNEGFAVAGQLINVSNFKELLDRASSISANPRAALILPANIKIKIAQKAKEALAVAETKEKERIAKLPRKYKATMTNCFVDSPCETFERVAIVAEGKVTVGDVSCPIQGRNDSTNGACSVVMENGRPASMREWDPADGFELTRISFGAQVTEGSYDPEMEANPYVKLQRQRVGQIIQEWEREKENARRNCKGLKEDAWIACAGAQPGN